MALKVKMENYNGNFDGNFPPLLRQMDSGHERIDSMARFQTSAFKCPTRSTEEKRIKTEVIS